MTALRVRWETVHPSVKMSSFAIMLGLIFAASFTIGQAFGEESSAHDHDSISVEKY